MSYQHGPQQPPYGPPPGYGPPPPRRPGRGPLFWLFIIGLPLVVLLSVVLALTTLGMPTVTFGAPEATPAGGRLPASPAPSAEAATLTVRGTMTVIGQRWDFRAIDIITCATRGGYTDIREGAQVTITDPAGTTIAVGELQEGRFVDGAGCAFDFDIPGVPPGHEFYGVEVAHRGRLQYPAAKLPEVLRMTLG